MFVGWFNEVARDVLAQPRAWQFLLDPITVAIVNNQAVIPSTLLDISQIEAGGRVFTPGNQLTAADAAGNSHAAGYTLAGRVVTFYPGAEGTALITGTRDITTEYTEETTSTVPAGYEALFGSTPITGTIFPIEFENLFITGLRMHYFDVDKDGRYTKENTQYQIQMNLMKCLDNRRKPRPQYHSKGYIR
jgi:hypothetical protein